MKRFFLLLVLLLALPVACSSAQEAQDVTADCRFSATTSRNLRWLYNGDCRSGYQTSGRKDCYVELLSDTPLHHLYIQWWGLPSEWILQTLKNGEWVDQGAYGQNGFVQEYVELNGETGIRIVSRAQEGRKAALRLHEVTAFGEGSVPAQVRRWEKADAADLMVVSAHPDDEFIFLGGLLPTYAAEREKDVLVVYLTYSSRARICELLDGLWTAGVRIHPMLGDRDDKKTTSLKKAYQVWDRDELCAWLVELVRTHRPRVMVTHDINGEYGHGAHMAAADVCMFAYDHAGDAAYLPGCGEPWQMDKLYLHLYEGNQQRFDWNVPLSSFGGKTGLEVAQDAFACHASQVGQKLKDAQGRLFVCEVVDGGFYDNALFGLWGTRVGADTQTGDLFENVLP